jgi:hypothetical protein
MRAVRATAAALVLVAAARVASAAEGPGCSAATVDEKLVPRLRAEQYVDVHQLALTLDALCPPDAVADARRVLDALALVGLGEVERGRALLFDVAARGADARVRGTADVIIAWSYLRARDDDAFRRRLPSLAADPRARLALLAATVDFAQEAGALPPAAMGPDVAQLVASYQAARRTKRTWLAATLSAVLPGAGQAYAGSWQAAAVSFVLNGALIGATVELGARRLYLPAAASGLAASFFYVGNIVNAADLAGHRNEVAADEPYRALEARLVPEAHP